MPGFIRLPSSEKKLLVYLIAVNLFITTAFAVVSHDQPLKFMPDEQEYVQLADKALHGDFNFDIGRFIRSPLYPLFIALVKIIFGGHWLNATIVIQILFQAVACAGLYFLAKEIFNRQAAIISALLFSIYIPCFYYIKAISSETLYQTNYIWLLYFFIISLKKPRVRYVIITGILFSLAYLNRSQIGLFAPFIAFGYLLNTQLTPGKRLLRIVTFIAIPVLITLPWGLTNQRIHDMYITSSNGGSWVFIAGNSNTGYGQFMNKLDINSKEYKEQQNLELSLSKEMNEPDIWSKSAKEKQQVFSAYGKKWVKENPGKFAKLKLKLAVCYFIPGLMKQHHPFKKWLMSFLISLPFYVLGYIGIIMALKTNWKNHLWFVGYFITILVLMVLIDFSSRFRTYGIEAIYLMYAAVPLSLLVNKLFPRLEQRSLFRN